METIEKVIAQMEARARKSSTASVCQSSKAIPEYVKDELPEQDEKDKEAEKMYNRGTREPREGIECPICGNKEVIFSVRKGLLYSRHCSCFKIRESWKRIRELELEQQVKKCTFESYETPQPWHKTAKEIALQFVENPDREWLLLAGQSGAGKTHLAVAAAFQLLQQGWNLHYMLWLRDAAKLKANINDTTAYDRMITPFRRCKVLYIDDFWKCKKGQAEPSDADVRLAFDILDYRYNNSGRITIISTEWTREELIRIDEAVGGRILEKSKDSQIVLVGEEKNWRLHGGTR